MELGENIKKAFKEKWGEFVSWWNNTAIVKWWNEKVVPWFTKEKWISLLDGMKKGIKEGFKSAANGAISVIESMLNWMIEKMNTLSIDVPKWLGGGKWGINIPRVYIPRFYDGGFVPRNVGQLFVANEPGNPELVGNIGGQTAVVNNGMILEGIKGAVKSAIVEGMTLVYGQQQNGDTYVDIYIDGVFTERRLLEENEKQMMRTGKPVFSR